MLTEIFLRYGQEQPPTKLIPLRAGPLSLLFDPASGMVRRIKLGEIEVLRGIYAAIRDHNWGTVPGVLREISRQVEPRSFHLKFASEHQQGNIHFTWIGIVRGEPDGTLQYEFEGVAKSNFPHNRIGFCVLHPIRECAGIAARQSRVDGTEVACRFPDLIEPQIFGRSTFQELRGITHEVMPGVSAQIEFVGEIFEMEDQRNWTDASFKTYCTPLALPFPVAIQSGSQISQSVTLRLVGDLKNRPAPPMQISSPQPKAHILTVPDTPTGLLPAIGLGVASHGQPLSETELDALVQLRLAHLRVDVRLADADSCGTLARAAGEATRLNAGLELALHLPRGTEANPQPLLRAVEHAGTRLSRILALREGEPATSRQTLAWVRKHFGALGALVGAGSDGNFCELNCAHTLGHLAKAEADLLFWPICPQVHAFDHLSVMETLEAQAATVRSARAFAGHRPLAVSPVTLKQRFNPVATSAVEFNGPDELPTQVDPRLLSSFAAAWTLGSIAALAAAGVDSVTYYETVGWRGVMECAAGSPLPGKFPSSPGSAFPVFHILAQIAGFGQVAPATCAAPQTLSALGLFADQRPKRVLIANLTNLPQTGIVVWPTGACSHLELEPYAVAGTDLPA